jgi:hypothetical protein
LVENPEGKKPLGRSRRKGVDNFKSDLREMVWSGMNWIYQAEDREMWRALVNMVMNLLVT